MKYDEYLNVYKYVIFNLALCLQIQNKVCAF